VSQSHIYSVAHTLRHGHPTLRQCLVSVTQTRTDPTLTQRRVLVTRTLDTETRRRVSVTRTLDTETRRRVSVTRTLDTETRRRVSVTETPRHRHAAPRHRDSGHPPDPGAGICAGICARIYVTPEYLWVLAPHRHSGAATGASSSARLASSLHSHKSFLIETVVNQKRLMRL
jgi:hypothetical protein